MPSKRKLKVLDGIHAGAELVLADGTYVIGSDFTCDMILLDKGVAKQHLRLRVAGQHIDAECMSDAGLELDGIKPSTSDVRFIDGVTITLGQVNLTIWQSAPSDSEPGMLQELPAPAPAPQQEMAIPVMAANAIADMPARSPAARYVLMSLAVISLLAGGFYFASRFKAGILSQPRFPIQRDEAERLSKAPAPASPEAFLERAQEFLTDDSLEVTLDKKGRIVVSGKTSSDRTRNDLQRLEKEFAGAIEVVDKVAYVFNKTPGDTQNNLLPLPQAITNVSVGKPSWFQTADGTRNFVGSKLADGAEVVRIGLHDVIFKRDGKLIAFQIDGKEFERDRGK